METWMVYVGAIGATGAVLAGLGKFLAGTWRVLQRVAAVLAVPEQLRQHAEDDAAFQEWMVSKLDPHSPNGGTER